MVSPALPYTHGCSLRELRLDEGVGTEECAGYNLNGDISVTCITGWADLDLLRSHHDAVFGST